MAPAGLLPANVASLVDQVRVRLQRTPLLRVSGGAGAGGGAGRRVRPSEVARQVASAQRYMQLRKAGKVEELLRLVSDDVVLESSRDGRHAGRDGLERYVRRVKPVGRWEKAGWNQEFGRAEIKGLVSILLVRVNVTAHFGFDKRGKINQIYVGTKKAKGGES